MSPTHAKVLAYFLEVAVTEWEAKFGELPSVERLMPTAAPEEPARAESPPEQPGEPDA
jgi:hypothetical protein